MNANTLDFGTVNQALVDLWNDCHMARHGKRPWNVVMLQAVEQAVPAERFAELNRKLFDELRSLA